MMFTEERQNKFPKLYEIYIDAEKMYNQEAFNVVLIKSRQIIEHICRYYYSAVGLQQDELINMINELYQIHLISNVSKNNYHQIRINGNKAAHEGLNDSRIAESVWKLITLELVRFFETEEQALSILASQPKKSKIGRNINRSKRNIIKSVIAVAVMICIFIGSDHYLYSTYEPVAQTAIELYTEGPFNKTEMSVGNQEVPHMFSYQPGKRFFSSNENVVKIDRRGKVTAVGKGEAVVVACGSNHSYTHKYYITE